jgi:16S rRNA (adenine1518-N6/adenine1519-N6)-dimethyltransferase
MAMEEIKVKDLPDLTSPRTVRELFEEHGLQPRKQLGQNFLIDANIVRKIAAVVDVSPGDAVIEVGPGAGALTHALALSGADLLAVEVDRGLAAMLNNLFQPWPEVKILHQDILKITWTDLIARFFPQSVSIKLVSNLPYVISGPFIYALLKENFPFQSAVLMLQKEVAHRLVADPGDSDYGGLSILCQYYSSGKILFDVSHNVFWPRPKVGSAVLKLEPKHRELAAKEEEQLWFLVQGVFQQRRKTMLNSLLRLLPHPRDLIVSLMEEAQVDPAIRPEQLSVDQFAKLAQITYNYPS